MTKYLGKIIAVTVAISAGVLVMLYQNCAGYKAKIVFPQVDVTSPFMDAAIEEIDAPQTMPPNSEIVVNFKVKNIGKSSWNTGTIERTNSKAIQQIFAIAKTVNNEKTVYDTAPIFPPEVRPASSGVINYRLKAPSKPGAIKLAVVVQDDGIFQGIFGSREEIVILVKEGAPMPTPIPSGAPGARPCVTGPTTPACRDAVLSGSEEAVADLQADASGARVRAFCGANPDVCGGGEDGGGEFCGCPPREAYPPAMAVDDGCGHQCPVGTGYSSPAECPTRNNDCPIAGNCCVSLTGAYSDKCGFACDCTNTDPQFCQNQLSNLERQVQDGELNPQNPNAPGCGDVGLQDEATQPMCNENGNQAPCCDRKLQSGGVLLNKSCYDCD